LRQKALNRKDRKEMPQRTQRKPENQCRVVGDRLATYFVGLFLFSLGGVFGSAAAFGAADFGAAAVELGTCAPCCSILARLVCNELDFGATVVPPPPYFFPTLACLEACPGSLTPWDNATLEVSTTAKIRTLIPPSRA